MKITKKPVQSIHESGSAREPEIAQGRRDEPPPSATHPWVALSGLVMFFAGAALIYTLRPFDTVAYDALLLIACVALGVVVPDLMWHRQWRMPSAKPDRAAAAASWRRTMVKFVGLLASLGFLGFCYWLFPEYTPASVFYRPFFNLLPLLIPLILVPAIPYLYMVDRRMDKPEDGLWQFGSMILRMGEGIDGKAVGQHLLGWLVKGYFLPLMFCYMCADTLQLYNYDFANIASFAQTWDFLFFFILYVDVVFGTAGYLMTLRFLGTHIRSSEPTLLGWVVAVICYEPFWNLIGRQYLAYGGSISWGQWLWDQPVIYGLWGVAILLLNAIYVWATVAFGVRFSNLTHRGIITSGPYRYSKHPAYLAKNLSYWLIAVPFVISESASVSLKHCMMLLMVNAIYYLRAKTEERHLRCDPDYVCYADWIEAHGRLRFVNRLPLIGRLARYRLQDLRPSM